MAVAQSFTLMLIPLLVILPVRDWLPLEYKGGLKTDTVHNCPKKGQNGLVSAAATAVAATTSPSPSKLDLDGLAMIKVIAAALNDYIAIKKGVGK